MTSIRPNASDAEVDAMSREIAGMVGEFTFAPGDDAEAGGPAFDGEGEPIQRTLAPIPGVQGPEIRRFQAKQTRFELQERVVLCLLTLRAPGNQRTVRDKSILNTNAAVGRLNITKRLIERPEFKAISILDGQMRDWMVRMSLPSPFKAGTHVIGIGLLQAVDDGLQAYMAQRAALVDEYIAVYERAVDEARKQLGELFSAGDYPDAASLRESYGMTWQYVTLAPPDQLKALNAEIFERERERLQAQWEESANVMRDALREGLAELVDDMVERLDGDEKKFKPTKLLGRFQEFLSICDAKNVTDDEEFQALADKARALLEGVDTEKLKTSAEIRERMRQGFKEAKGKLDEMEVVSKRARQITFEDE